MTVVPVALVHVPSGADGGVLGTVGLVVVRVTFQRDAGRIVVQAGHSEHLPADFEDAGSQLEGVFLGRARQRGQTAAQGLAGIGHYGIISPFWASPSDISSAAMTGSGTNSTRS